MFIVSLHGADSESTGWAWDFPTQDKAEEFVTLFNAQCSALIPDGDTSSKYSLHVSRVFDEPASSFEEMFAIWQSTAQPPWLVTSAQDRSSDLLAADSPGGGKPVDGDLVLPEGSLEEIFDDLVLRLGED